MLETLLMAVAQPKSVLHDVAFNAEHHAAAVRAAHARVVVFPELSLTGYGMDVQPIEVHDPRLQPIIQACRETRSIALIGAPTFGEQGEVHISMLRVDGNEAVVAYNKIWLGANEKAFFSPGREPSVIEVDGWRLGLAICKDTGVADHAAAIAALGIDVYVAGVCETEQDRDVPPERAARVIRDHNLRVAIASFAGSTGGGFDETAGRSAIWRLDGTNAVVLDRQAGQVARTPISPN